jgi:hypothetical protein
MREIRPSGLEGGVALTAPSLPLSNLKADARFGVPGLRGWADEIVHVGDFSGINPERTPGRLKAGLQT